MKDIKNRIKSVESTMQITKAMELVASSKLRRAKERVEKSRPFFEILQQALFDISKSSSDFSSVFTTPREVKKTCFVVIAGDRGLAGGYNSNVLKAAMEKANGGEYCILPIGKKTAEYFDRKKAEILSKDFNVTEDITISDCYQIGLLLAKKYKEGAFDRLYVCYTKFVSVLSQVPVTQLILPVSAPETKEKKAHELMICEPSPSAAFDLIIPQYLGGIMYGAVAEAQASEFGARRTAMESANKNAGEMIEELNLRYNRARQAAITQELTEIVSGAEALD